MILPSTPEFSRVAATRSLSSVSSSVVLVMLDILAVKEENVTRKGFMKLFLLFLKLGPECRFVTYSLVLAAALLL